MDERRACVLKERVEGDIIGTGLGGRTMVVTSRQSCAERLLLWAHQRTGGGVGASVGADDHHRY